MKIGLTATPALHTKEIFGAPDLLVLVPRGGRRRVPRRPRAARSASSRSSPRTASTTTRTRRCSSSTAPRRRSRRRSSPDEIQFDVDDFNRRVITEHFNRAVLARAGQPHRSGRRTRRRSSSAPPTSTPTWWCVLLKEALKAKYGAVDDDAVAKITGATDRPLEAIRRYRNERDAEHRRHRRPAHHGHRRPAHREPRVPAPRAEPHPLRADDRAGHAPLPRDRQGTVPHLRRRGPRTRRSRT